MVLPLPRASVMGVVDYLALATGLGLGFAVLSPIAADLQERFKKGGNGA